MKPVFILHVFMKSSLSLSLCCWCLWYPIQEVTTLTSLRNFGLLFSSKNCRVSGLTLRSQTPFWIHFVYVQVEVPVHSSACETRFSQHYLLCWPLLPYCLLLSFLTKHLQLAPPSTVPNRGGQKQAFCFGADLWDKHSIFQRWTCCSWGFSDVIFIMLRFPSNLCLLPVFTAEEGRISPNPVFCSVWVDHMTLFSLHPVKVEQYQNEF